MAVYYKFKSAKDYVSIPIDGHFIPVSNLKDRIYESKHLGRGTDHDIEVINAQTNEEYPHEAVIPKNTSVLIRRVPRRSGMPIVTRPEESMVESRPNDDLPKANLTSAVSNVKDLEPPEWDDEFGHDLYAPIPEIIPSQAIGAVWEDPPPSKDDEDSKIKALIETSALDWQSQGAEGFGGRGFGRGGRMMGGRGFGRIGERKIPPQGYVCHRCRVPGHFIQHCPTNGDPNFDTKKVRPPTGIPKTMLMANPEGTMVMPSGAVGVLQPNEAAFEKEMEGIPSTRSLGDLPPELHCPLCKEVIKDAVLTSKCCFTSFCDKCIRDYIISKSICVCGVRDILADDLLPNKTLRDTINRILSSTNSSGDNAGSAFQVQDMESARHPQPKVASPIQSAAVKLEHMPPASVKDTTPNPKETADAERSADPPPQPLTQQTSGKLKTAKVPDISEASHESASAREPASQGSALPAEEEVQQKLAAAEVKKKKKKKPRLPVNATEMQWRGAQDFAADSFMMPMGPSSYNPYWNGMQPGFQPGMDGYMGSYGGGMPYNMGYGIGPMDVHFPGVVPHDPFMAQNPMFPMMPPPRDLGMGFNVRPPLMTRQEFEARKAGLRRKREIERMSQREMPKDRDPGREVSSSVNALSMKSKSHSAPSRREPSEERYDRERSRHHNDDYDHHRPHHGMSSNGSSKRNSDYHQPSSDGYDNRDRDRENRHHHYRRSESSTKPSSEVPLPAPSPQKPSSAAAAERKQKSVFARISFPEKGEEPSKKRKHSSEPKPSRKEAVPPANGEGLAASSSMSRKSHRQSQVDYESSDDDRHFKRKPSRYQPSPPPRQEDTRRMNDRGRERERDSGGHSSRYR